MLFEPNLVTTADGGVLLDLEHDRLLKLNPIAAQFWKELVAGKTEDEIVDEISAEHGVSRDRVKQDLRALQSRIDDLGLTIKSGPGGLLALSPNTPGSLPSFPWYAGKHRQLRTGSHRFCTMAALVGLLAFDCVLSLLSMKSLCRLVQCWPTTAQIRDQEIALLERICVAVERACVWYPRKTLCLQRSAVATCMLRSAGLPAQLVIGAQPMPLQAHAWVEVRGSVVNDHRGVAHVYKVLARY